ncbi:MAG: transcriptional regulator [Nanoarchaeota archaeon]|nr:transcriptional regulator [Nanoarchaeota archaeon]
MSKRRTRMDIISDILVAIQRKGGIIKPTHLLYKANLSHKLMNSYLEELLDKELIGKVEKSNHQYIIIKDQGLEFLEKFNKLREFQDAFGL